MANNNSTLKQKKKTLMVVPHYVGHTTEKRVYTSQDGNR